MAKFNKLAIYWRKHARIFLIMKIYGLKLPDLALLIRPKHCFLKQ
jgi:hypothetical protein